ncbi:MAG: FadR/GntR family transcriptional regulator [Anaerolineaceae bacterium]
MAIKKKNEHALSEFLNYLSQVDPSNNYRIPALAHLSKELGVSIASLREQLEVARMLGLVEVRPKTGIRRLKYTFQPAVTQSLAYALTIDPQAFRHFSDLRNHIEATYWYEAVSRLTVEDLQYLNDLLEKAEKKLKSHPVQLPHEEHRELHLCIFRRLNNPFVIGLLEAYWEEYESIGLNVYTDLIYLEKVWMYHRKMVVSLINGEYAAGYQALLDHTDLLLQRSKPLQTQQFE